MYAVPWFVHSTLIHIPQAQLALLERRELCYVFEVMGKSTPLRLHWHAFSIAFQVSGMSRMDTRYIWWVLVAVIYKEVSIRAPTAQITRSFSNQKLKIEFWHHKFDLSLQLNLKLNFDITNSIYHISIKDRQSWIVIGQNWMSRSQIELNMNNNKNNK